MSGIHPGGDEVNPHPRHLMVVFSQVCAREMGTRFFVHPSYSPSIAILDDFNIKFVEKNFNMGETTRNFRVKHFREKNNQKDLFAV